MSSIPGCRIVSILMLTIFMFAAAGVPEAAMKKTILATVMDGYQLVDDEGQPYEVADTDRGNDLVLNHIGRRVEVIGTVQDEVDYKVIIVESFRVIED